MENESHNKYDIEYEMMPPEYKVSKILDEELSGFDIERGEAVSRIVELITEQSIRAVEGLFWKITPKNADGIPLPIVGFRVDMSDSELADITNEYIRSLRSSSSQSRDGK